MGKKQYVVESDFDDLHGNADTASDLEVDLSDSDNPIITAALGSEDEDWKPPAKDDKEKDEPKDLDEEDEDDEDEDEDLDTDEDDDEDDDQDVDDDEEEEDDDDDDKKYSKSVQKRIEREREARRRDKEDADRRIAKLERQSSLRDARDEFRTEQQEAESKLRELRQKKIRALDEGEDAATVVDIDDKILDIRANLKAKELELKSLEKDIDTNDDAPASSNTPEEGRKFLEKYPQFHTSKAFRDVVLLTDKSVMARGFDKNTREYYAEMEKILKPQFPKIIKLAKITTKARKKKRPAAGSTTRPGTRRAGAKRTRSGVVRLTAKDQHNMQIFGMDPTNPADVKAWAENKGQ